MSLKYSQDHEWIDLNGSTARVGISTFAAAALGDVVFVELPEVGRVVAQGEESGVVESVKAASDVYAPLSGEITKVNSELESSPETVNAEPEGAGWFFEMKLSNPEELDRLMDASAYKSFCDEQ